MRKRGTVTEQQACMGCGGPCQRPPKGPARKWCSERCRGLSAQPARTCKACGEEYVGHGKEYCSSACYASTCRVDRPPKVIVDRDLRSPTRRAYESRDYPALLSALMARTARTHDGCIEWQGRVHDGYPMVRMGPKYMAVHRLVVEATLGAPLGSQHAHHTCANSRCVNPEHLQAVTARDNIAEMLARQSYLARIAELEEALVALAPGHPVLQVLPVY